MASTAAALRKAQEELDDEIEQEEEVTGLRKAADGLRGMLKSLIGHGNQSADRRFPPPRRANGNPNSDEDDVDLEQGDDDPPEEDALEGDESRVKAGRARSRSEKGLPQIDAVAKKTIRKAGPPDGRDDEEDPENPEEDSEDGRDDEEDSPPPARGQRRRNDTDSSGEEDGDETDGQAAVEQQALAQQARVKRMPPQQGPPMMGKSAAIEPGIEAIEGAEEYIDASDVLSQFVEVFSKSMASLREELAATRVELATLRKSQVPMAQGVLALLDSQEGFQKSYGDQIVNPPQPGVMVVHHTSPSRTSRPKAVSGTTEVSLLKSDIQQGLERAARAGEPQAIDWLGRLDYMPVAEVMQTLPDRVKRAAGLIE